MKRTITHLVLLPAFALSGPRALAYTLKQGGGITVTGWARTSLIFDYDYSSCPTSVSAAQLNAAFDGAIALWNSVPTSGLTVARGAPVSATFAQVNATTTPHPIILCDPNFSAHSGLNGDTTLAMGVAYWDQTGSIYQGYILMNAESGKLSNIRNSNPTQLEIVFAHEMGHVLGLGHSALNAALMYQNLTGKTQAALTQDDMDGVSHLYPKAADSSSPAMGCGSIAMVGAQAGEKHLRRGRRSGRTDRDDTDPTGGAAAETGGLFMLLTGFWLAFRKKSKARLVWCAP
jgi:hypothetical protein